MAQDRCPDTRWAWIEVDTGALRRNLRTFKELLNPGVKMMVIIKADAYGHGAYECAKALHTAGADQFGIATVAEGIALRERGFGAPLVILSEPPVECVKTLLEHNLIPTVCTQEFALAFGECAAAMDTVGQYHLAIDTGMTRIGVDCAEALEFRRAIDFHRGLECVGTFTHFATADVPNDWTVSLQYQRFKDAVSAMKAAGVDCGLLHCANTAATVLYPDMQLDMCRVGVGLYGLHPADTTRPRISLEPAMSVRARVTRAVYPCAGAGVSYGHTYTVARQNTQIATIPLGYADGLSRALSDKMDVLVNGVRCPQVGTICMDQCMFAVDVDERRSPHPIREVAYGDTVTILGADGAERIYAEELANLRGTINYEVTCNFGARLEKVYV